MISGKGRLVINITIFSVFCYAVFNMFVMPKQSSNMSVGFFVTALLAALLLLVFDWMKLRQQGTKETKNEEVNNKAEIDRRLKIKTWIFFVFISFLIAFGVVIHFMDKP